MCVCVCVCECIYVYILPWWLSNKESTCNAGDVGSNPGLERSPGGCNDNPLQCSCLGNPMCRGAWRATVHGVAKNRTRISDQTFLSLVVLGLCCRPWVLSGRHEQGLLSSPGARAPHCTGSSRCRARALELRLYSCGTSAELGPSQTRGQPVSPALASGSL